MTPEVTSKHRETPGSEHWKAAVIRDLREGYGVEDIALRMECDVQAVRDLVAYLRKHGVLPWLYQQARREWQSVGTLAARHPVKVPGLAMGPDLA